MQRSQLRPQVQPATPALRTGPVPLDSKHLQLVAGGGAPRGGWITTESTTTQAPRGGWL
jgi:hypothetical protein